MHRLLRRQLRKLGLATSVAPAETEWAQMLEQVDQAYALADQDRYLLERSLAISSREMQDLYDNLRRTSESRLAEEHERLQAVLDHVGDGIITYDPEGVIESFNLASERIFGHSAAEIVGRRASLLLAPSVQDRYARLDDGRLAGQATGVVEAQRVDGTTFPMEYKANPVQLGDKHLVIVIVRDITDRLEAQRKMLAVQKLESLGVLAGGIAHDFNNLLVAILGQTSLARKRLPAGEPARAHIDKAVRSAELAADLTRQMLAYSGRSQLEVRPLRIDELIRRNRHVFDAMGSKSVGFDLQLSEGLPLVDGDAGQMQQVILNVVLNAAESLGRQPGTVRVTTATHAVGARDGLHWQPTGEPAEPGRYVTVTVADDGPGMDSATLERIFDPFFTTKDTGRGLGLAAVLGIMRGHGGGLQVTSAPGRGTTFRLFFPVSSAPSAEIDAVQDEGAAAGGGELILVVDDEAPVREAIADFFELEGLDALCAPDGATGLKLLAERRDEIRLVLLDMSMPGLSGEDTLRELLALAPDVPVVVMSGFSEADVSGRFGERSPAGFIQKPFDVDTLVATVRRHLANGGLAESSEPGA